MGASGLDLVAVPLVVALALAIGWAVDRAEQHMRGDDD